MARRILITNGDHAANALAAYFPDAEILIWRDVLVEGPVPGGIGNEALADVRAQHIENAFGVRGVRSDFTRRDRAFEKIAPSDRVELWFETDLHDQLQLIQILDRFHAQQTSRTPLLLTLAAPPLLSHIDAMAEKLVPVTGEQLAEGAALWAAFRAPDPGPMIEASSGDSALPEVRDAFARMLDEFPSSGDGLGRIERNALLALRDGALTPGLAFRHYQQTEPLPFLGDLGFFHRLEALGRGPSPLLRGLPEGGIAHAARTNMTVEYTETLIELTDAGHAVLEGRADFVRLNGIDRWIGGVHLSDENVWRR
ncbi:MAG: hypothetical protein KF835_10030 [Xanthobacteraceae bacterium]|nr:hypothetical protein [Xanthobacteraceae bacterium]